jgi:glycyl-tRNA synthetase beta chain
VSGKNMSNLILELFSEEIPARMQLSILQQAQDVLTKHLALIGIDAAKFESYVTPRRMVFAILELPSKITRPSISLRGPKINAPKQAIEGFLKKNNLSDIDDLTVKQVKKEQYYFYEIVEFEDDLAKILPELLHGFIANIAKLWPKTMRWGSYNTRWVRPLRNILCLLDDKLIKFNYAHLTSNNQTYGHRVLNDNLAININNYTEYFTKLAAAKVVLCHKKRKDYIIKSLNEQAQKHELALFTDESLIDEVCGLVEYPVILIGKIAPEFLTLPQEILITTLKNHQKCFCLKDKNGDIAPYFVFVSNNDSKDNQRIILGNEKVVAARLNDAKYFYQTDIKTSLTANQDKLQKIIFHKQVGTMMEHAQNNAVMAKFVSAWVKNSHLVEAEVAANLAKIDLTTEIIGEFPELQGVAGYYYALQEGLDKNIALAIKEHYLPRNLADPVPTRPLSVSLAIADKLNSLVALILVNELPNGSKDPYGVRRFALGIIRIILHNKLHIPLGLIIEKSINNYFSLIKRHKEFYPDYEGADYKVFIQQKLLSFILERYKIILKDKNISHDIINALVSQDQLVDDLLIIYNKAKLLDQMTKTMEGKEFLASYRRVYKIYYKAQQEDGVLYDKKPHYLALKNEAEKNLYKVSKDVKSELTNLVKQGDYDDAFRQVQKFTLPINQFFDQVVVNDNNKNLRENRLKLLATICKTVNNLADFSKIGQ